jgi:hypothetical protein
MNQLDYQQEKEYSIFINGREKQFVGKSISFDEVTAMAFGSSSPGKNTIYTVTYSRGNGEKPEGTLVSGDSVKVKEGMRFNVTATNKS